MSFWRENSNVAEIGRKKLTIIQIQPLNCTVVYKTIFLFQKFGTKSGKPTEKISIIGSGELV